MHLLKLEIEMNILVYINFLRWKSLYQRPASPHHKNKWEVCGSSLVIQLIDKIYITFLFLEEIIEIYPMVYNGWIFGIEIINDCLFV